MALPEHWLFAKVKSTTGNGFTVIVTIFEVLLIGILIEFGFEESVALIRV